MGSIALLVREACWMSSPLRSVVLIRQAEEDRGLCGFVQSNFADWRCRLAPLAQEVQAAVC